MESVQHNPPKDTSAGDYDEPFDGFRPTQFTLRQRARLLVLRGRVQEARLGNGALQDDLAA